MWEEGECSANCGGGTRTKNRTVVQQAQNGGTCPELTKLEVCNTEGCKGSLLFQRKQLYLIFLLNISFQSTARLKFGPIGVSVTQTAEEGPRPERDCVMGQPMVVLTARVISLSRKSATLRHAVFQVDIR